MHTIELMNIKMILHRANTAPSDKPISTNAYPAVLIF